MAARAAQPTTATTASQTGALATKPSVENTIAALASDCSDCTAEAACAQPVPPDTRLFDGPTPMRS